MLASFFVSNTPLPLPAITTRLCTHSLLLLLKGCHVSFRNVDHSSVELGRAGMATFVVQNTNPSERDTDTSASTSVCSLCLANRTALMYWSMLTVGTLVT